MLQASQVPVHLRSHSNAVPVLRALPARGVAGRSDRCVAVSPCFHVRVPGDIDMGTFSSAFTIRESSLVSCVLRSLAHFPTGSFLVVRVLSIFWITVLHRMCLWQLFPPSLWLVLIMEQNFSFERSSLYHFFVVVDHACRHGPVSKKVVA